MLHVVTKDNRHLYEQELEEHYRIRYQIYVKERRWMALARPDEREVDQFDTDDAVYLLNIEDGKVISGSRLVPTLRPHLMSEIFPYLASVKGLRRDYDTVEWTRIFISPSKRGNEGSAFNATCAAVFQFCLEEQIEWVSVVLETWWLPRLLKWGWTFELLGLPHDHDDMEIVATRIPVTSALVDTIKAAKGLKGSMLIRRGLHGPVWPDMVPGIQGVLT